MLYKDSDAAESEIYKGLDSPVRMPVFKSSSEQANLWPSVRNHNTYLVGQHTHKHSMLTALELVDGGQAPP